MKRLLLALILGFGFLFITSEANAGEIYIEDVRISGSCVKVEFGSTEDDTGDHVEIKVWVAVSKTGKKLWKASRVFRNVDGPGKYVEFCGDFSIRPSLTYVAVTAWHNGKREDVMTLGERPPR